MASGMRLVVSCISSFLILSLLLFMVHRLRQRRRERIESLIGANCECAEPQPPPGLPYPGFCPFQGRVWGKIRCSSFFGEKVREEGEAEPVPTSGSCRGLCHIPVPELSKPWGRQKHRQAFEDLSMG
jgi:hypothetical protein